MALRPESTFGNNVLKFDKLNGENYRSWAFNMRLYLESVELYGHADGSAQIPEDATVVARRSFSSAAKKAWTYICLAVEPEQQIHVRDTTTAKEVWDNLKSQFARESILQKVRLRRQYYSCRFVKGGDMLGHINHLKSLHDQLREMGVNIDDKELAMTLLASLPEEFKPLITALDAVGEDNVTYKKVKAMLLDDLDRSSDIKKSEVEDAYFVRRSRGGNFSKKNNNPNDRGHKVEKASFRGTCHCCQERGHYARDCPKKKVKDGSAKGSAKCAVDDGEVIDEEALLTSADSLKDNGWIIDSGASQHMTFERHHLSDYIEFKQPTTVYLGDNRTIKAYGKGTYRLVADLGGQTQRLVLHEVLYLPELERNLLSVHAMAKMGASVAFGNKQCKVTRNEKLLAVGEMRGKLYMLNTIREEHVSVAEVNSNLYLWHCRMGHLGMNDVKKLVKEEMVNGIRKTDITSNNADSLCESCIMGKQHCASYPKGSLTRANQPFELIHSDICGPISVISHGGSRYFITFIDDYSTYTYTYFLKHKDEALEKLKEFVRMVTNLTGRKIKTLRSDNGGEYCSKLYESYLKEEGIQHRRSSMRKL